MQCPFRIQTMASEAIPTPSEGWETIATAATTEAAYDLYITEFRRQRADGREVRVRVLFNGTPISLIPGGRR